MKVSEIYSLARRELRRMGVEAADMEARFITSWVSKIPLGQEVLSGDGEIAGVSERLEEVLARREKREPLQLIFGEWEFYGRNFFIEPGVLIPRQETEVLVEAALVRLKEFDGRRLTGLDIGSGTGVICVTMLAEMENLEMIAVDIAEKAVTMTKKNAGFHGVSDRLQVYMADFREFPVDDPCGLDFIISNPPYLSQKEFALAMPEVKDYEPEGALVGGETGMQCIEDLIRFSGDNLVPGGMLFIEFGYGQRGELMNRFARDSRFEKCEIIRDLAQIPRVSVARKGRGERGERK